MNVGMFWFDNDPRTPLEKKVERAADYYKQKYGLEPDLCLVHPSMGVANEQVIGKIKVRPNRAILPGHLYICKEER